MTLDQLLAGDETLAQVRYYHRDGRIADEVFRAYLHFWQTNVPRFSVQACHCAECLAPARKVEEDF